MRVRRRRQLARGDAHAVDADAGGAGGAAEHLPLRIHLALGGAVPLDVVPVRKTHDGADYWASDQRNRVLVSAGARPLGRRPPCTSRTGNGAARSALPGRVELRRAAASRRPRHRVIAVRPGRDERGLDA